MNVHVLAKEWVFFQVIEERSRWFLWCPAVFAIGVALFFNLTWQPDLYWLVLPVPFAVVLCFPVQRRFHGIILLLFFCLIVSTGFCAAFIRQILVDAPVLQRKTVTVVSGVIEHKSAGSKKVRLLLSQLNFDKTSLPALRKVRITTRSPSAHLHPGQRVSIRAVLLPPPAPAYPGAYDFQRDSYFKQIGAVGYSIGAASIVEEDPAGRGFPVLRIFAKLRDRVNRYVLSNAPPETAGFSIAIMSGDKSSIKKQQLEQMRSSGLAHLLAISGLHMGMVGGLIFYAVRLGTSFWPRIALNYPTKKWAAFIALMGLTGYLFVSGMSVSALRAYLMISMIFYAVCFDRTALSLRNLALAAMIILIFLPESLLTAGFQMSFAAVFCLIAAYEHFGEAMIGAASRAGVVRRLLYYPAGIIFTSLIASLATAPFAIYHFGQFSSLGIVANLVAVPLMGLWVMPWTLISFAVMPFADTAIPLELAGFGIGFILQIAEWVSALPGAVFRIGAYPTVFLVGSVFAVLWGLIWRNRIRWLASIIFVGVIPSLFTLQLPDILYADSGNLFLIRQQDGQAIVNSLRADRFERERWQLLFGLSSVQKIMPGYNENSAVNCDAVGCLYRRDNKKIAFAENWMATEMDCARSDILLSAVPVAENCQSPQLVIDKFDLWRFGTYALYFKERGQVQVRTVNGVRGDRPWVPTRYRERPMQSSDGSE